LEKKGIFCSIKSLIVSKIYLHWQIEKFFEQQVEKRVDEETLQIHKSYPTDSTSYILMGEMYLEMR
jgi:hypothetical protein